MAGGCVGDGSEDRSAGAITSPRDLSGTARSGPVRSGHLGEGWTDTACHPPCSSITSARDLDRARSSRPRAGCQARSPGPAGWSCASCPGPPPQPRERSARQGCTGRWGSGHPTQSSSAQGVRSTIAVAHRVRVGSGRAVSNAARHARPRIGVITATGCPPKQAAIGSMTSHIRAYKAAPPTHGPGGRRFDTLEDTVASLGSDASEFRREWGSVGPGCRPQQAPRPDQPVGDTTGGRRRPAPRVTARTGPRRGGHPGRYCLVSGGCT